MKRNTLTTINNLLPGDIFKIDNDPAGTKYIKTGGEPFTKNKRLYNNFAAKINELLPKPFETRTTVIFLKKSKLVKL